MTAAHLAVDPDVLGRAQIAAADALIDSGLGRQIRGDGNTIAAVVNAVLAAAVPALLTPPLADAAPPASGHGAEAYRLGQPPSVSFGWQCLICNLDVGQLGAAAVAERAAAAHNAIYDTPADTITAAVRAFQLAVWPTLAPDVESPRIWAGVEAAYHVIAGAVTERNAATVEELCHWVQRIGNARAETHREFHFGFTCPYEASATVLRGQPDPRGSAGGPPASDSGPSNEVEKPEPHAEPGEAR